MNNQIKFAKSGDYITYKDGTSSAQAMPATTSALTPVGQVFTMMPIQPKVMLVCPSAQSAGKQ
jgi:PAB1-binding protein PBP1